MAFARPSLQQFIERFRSCLAVFQPPKARAFGVGVIIGTQNPTDLAYRALGNAGVWSVDRLQSDADRASSQLSLQVPGG